MGLGSVELVMGFEAAFGIVIPDAVAEEMITPRHTIDYVASSLDDQPGCSLSHAAAFLSAQSRTPLRSRGWTSTSTRQLRSARLSISENGPRFGVGFGKPQSSRIGRNVFPGKDGWSKAPRRSAI